MRIAVSAVVFLVALLAGAKTQWVALSVADAPAAEDRAFAAAVLGETGPNATSAELIDAAVSRGEISPERGLLYGVYLACDADRLPAQFRGADARGAARNVLWEADVDWASLTPETQQEFSEFFAAHFRDDGSVCGEEIRRLADHGDVWWVAALPESPNRPDGATYTASRP
ncbi:MAG: hypothetical protein MUC34_17590 [Anaerolineae bacterium]|nr:hypothetical protein [Anaerolineae bacterium]